MTVQPKEISVQIVVYGRGMFLRIKVGEEVIDLPYDQAEEMLRILELMVPYRHGVQVSHTPIRFKGRTPI